MVCITKLFSEKKMVSKEIKDIAIAWIVLSVAFAFIFSGLTLFGILQGNLIQALSGFIIMFPVSLLIVGTSFVLHELGHRNVARHFNYFAEFRKWNFGLMFALGVSFLIGAIFAAPGAVYIGNKRKRQWEKKSRWDQEYPEYTKNGLNEMGLISVAGIVINIILGLIFLGLLLFALPLFTEGTFVHQIMRTIFTLGYVINFILAGFNLLPIGPLDGNKVMKWNPIIWAVLFFPIAYWYFFMLGI